MRVLHLLDHAALRQTEYARRTFALLGSLRAQGVQTVQLTAPSAARQAEHMPDGWHVYRTPAPAGLRYWPRRWRPLAGCAALALRLRQVARLTRPDLIHVHAPGSHALAAWPAARLERLPLLLEAERRDRPVLTRLERAVFKGADAVAAATPELRTALRAGGLDGQRIAVLPAAADLPGVQHARTGPAGLEGAPLLAYAGDLEACEGINLLLEALAVLRASRPALRLLVAGGGARGAVLEQRADIPALRGHVVFTGTLAARRAADLLPRADIVVFPALPGRLPSSRQLLNAMAQGCAVVASDLACHRELILHGHSGILFRAGSRASLVEALAGLLEEPCRLRPLGAAAAAFIAAQRSWTATAARYRRLYAQILTDAVK